MKIATYSRVSTNKREQKPEVHVGELRRYCKARGFKITHEITDRARGGTDDRPGFKELMRLVRAREAEAVAVVKLDRLFRSLKHLVNTLSEFEALGVKFIATHDQVDLTTPAGRMFVQILGSLGEFERALTRERIMLGLEHARRNGKKLGRPKLNDDEKVRELRTHGMSYQGIQKHLGVSKGSVCRALAGMPKKRLPKMPQERRVLGGYGAGDKRNCINSDTQRDLEKARVQGARQKLLFKGALGD